MNDINKLFRISAKDVPNNIPIFPMQNILLLPFGKLPLNLFEERYLKMFFSVLKKDRLIGIVQQKDNSGDLFEMGCIGKITSFIETPDNRIALNLDGVCRFKIIDSQISNDGYFTANINKDEYSHDFDLIEPMINREALIKKYSDFFKFKKYNLDSYILEETSNLQLLTTLTMLAPFNNIDKQAILEAKNIIERLKIINAILDLNTFRVVTSDSKH